jgi:hypothetical protein
MLGAFNRAADEQGLNASFDETSRQLQLMGLRYSRAQTGAMHGYLRVLALSFVVLAVVVILGGAR